MQCSLPLSQGTKVALVAEAFMLRPHLNRKTYVCVCVFYSQGSRLTQGGPGLCRDGGGFGIPTSLFLAILVLALANSSRKVWGISGSKRTPWKTGLKHHYSKHVFLLLKSISSSHHTTQMICALFISFIQISTAGFLRLSTSELVEISCQVSGFTLYAFTINTVSEHLWILDYCVILCINYYDRKLIIL